MQQPVKTQVDPSIFRAYDIRGIVGETMTTESVFLIGKAVGSLARDNGEHQIVIARDGRESGPVLSAALRDGILSAGCDVMDIGVAPTPLLYYATAIFAEHSGVMLTGSHNPPNYNGLKMVVNGKALAEEDIKALYQRIVAEEFHEGLGVCHELTVIDKYLDQITQSIKLKRKLKVVVDAGNGVGGMIAPELFKRMGCDVVEMFCDVDGTFPNHHADPSQPENLEDLKAAMQEQQADIGLAFDGDADRLGVVTSRGDIIWPDRLLMLYAKALMAERDDVKVIYDVKCTSHLADLVKKHGGEPIMWKTGHSLIKAKMAETGAQIGGEMSGHFFFKDKWYGFDDALYAGARLLEILAAQELDSASLFDTIPNSVNTPEIKISVAEDEKFGLMQRLIDSALFASAKEITTIDGLRVNFADGWGLVRPSNTSPYLVLRFEANSNEVLTQIKDMFKEWITSVEPDVVLPY